MFSYKKTLSGRKQILAIVYLSNYKNRIEYIQFYFSLIYLF